MINNGSAQCRRNIRRIEKILVKVCTDFDEEYIKKEDLLEIYTVEELKNILSEKIQASVFYFMRDKNIWY